MRSALTTLGIIIGVGAVIAMVEISQGSKTALMQTMSTMGANNLSIRSGAATSGGISFGSGSEKTLTPDDAIQIREQCSDVAAVAPIVEIRGQVVRGNHNWTPMNIYGTVPDYLVVRDWNDMDAGDMFTDQDVRGGDQDLASSARRSPASCFPTSRRSARIFAFKTWRCAWSACWAQRART